VCGTLECVYYCSTYYKLLASVCLLLQYPLQRYSRGVRGIVERDNEPRSVWTSESAHHTLVNWDP
jgi:hypothetical protein